MKLHSIFISALLITGFSAHAMEQTATPVDLKAQLQAHVLASDATNFKDSWHNYQATAQAQEVRAMQSVLINLAAQLRAHKDQERTTKLNDTSGRRLAGACAIPSVLLLGIPAFFLCVIIKNLMDNNILILTALLKKKFKLANTDAISITVIIVFAGFIGRLALKDINYARFAGTEQLTKEINALDEILACLNPQTPELVDTETEINHPAFA